MKIRNTLFTILTSLFLLGPLTLAIATDGFGMLLPDWFTSKEAEMFDGAKKQENILGAISLKGFSEKTTQDALENQAGCYIPMKAKARLLNASIQRSAIASSNIAFNFTCYPTYFGSNKIFIPKENALSWTPSKQSDSTRKKLEKLGEKIAGFANRHPDKRIMIYIPGGLHTPSISPAFAYMDSSIDTKYVANTLRGKTNKAENITVIADQYETLEEYYRNYWRTDHHWNSLGAAKAYNEIAAAWNKKPFIIEGVEPIDMPPFSGRTAPASLDMVSEEAFDITNDFSDLTIYSIDNSTTWKGNDHSYFWSKDQTLRQYEFNAAWMLSKITTRIEGPGVGKSILVSDSYGAALQRIVAQQYKVTYIPWSLSSEKKGDDRLIDMLDDDVRDVYIVADVSDLRSFLKRFPHYFEG